MINRRTVIFFFVSGLAQAAGPALTTAASIATVIGQGDTVIQTVHHPVVQMRAIKAKTKKLFTFHRNDGKVHTLPLPASPPPSVIQLTPSPKAVTE